MARFSMRQPVVLPHEKDDLQRLFHSDSAASSTNSSVSWSLDITEKSDDRGDKITKMKPKFSNPSQEWSQDTATDSWEQSEKNDISYTMGNSNNKHTTPMKSSHGISSPNDVRDDTGSICNFMPAPGTILCFDCNSSTMSELTKPVMKDDRKKAQCPPPCCRPTGDPADAFEETMNNLSSVSERSLDSVMPSDICGDNPPKDLLGKAVNAFRSGVHGILSCSDKICNPQKANNDSVPEKKLDETATTASLTPSASCESLHRMGAYKSENMSQSKPNNNDNKGNVSQEMDQLLKVLWDKEAVVTLSGAAGHEADMTISPLTTLTTYADAEKIMEYSKNASLFIGNLPPVKEAGCPNKLSDMMGHMNFFKDDSTIIDEGNDVNDSVVGTALISTPSTVDLSHPLVEAARSESDEEKKHSSILTAAVTPSPAKKNPVDDSQDTSGLLSYSVSGQWSGIVSPEKQILDKDEVDIMFGSDDVQYVAADNKITMTKPPLSPRTPTSKILIKPPPPSRLTTAKKGMSMKKVLNSLTTPIAPKKSYKKQIEMTVEDGEDDTNTKNTNEEQASFVADFTSKDARVSMGLPASSSVDQNGFPIAKEEEEESSSPSSDPSVRICAWCRRGGEDDIKFTKKLKLCSACQTTYYCR